MHFIVLSMKTKCQGKKPCTVIRLNMVLKKLKIKYNVKKNFTSFQY